VRAAAALPVIPIANFPSSIIDMNGGFKKTFELFHVLKAQSRYAHNTLAEPHADAVQGYAFSKSKWFWRTFTDLLAGLHKDRR
jgi:hypothetical protein